MPSPLSKDHLIAILEKHLAVNPDRLTLSTVKEGNFDQIFEARTDQGSYILRLGPPDEARRLFFEQGGMQREVDLLTVVRAKTVIPVLNVIAADFSRGLIDRDFYIAQKLEGTLYSQATSLTHEQHNHIFFQLGQYLSELHRLIGPAYGYNGVETSLIPQPTWYQAFKLMWSNLIQDIIACGMYDAQEADDLIALLDYHRDCFKHDFPPALLYMSSHKENITVDLKGNITGLQGFDVSLWGDPEIDFAVLDCAGIWASSFWDGYGGTRPDDLESRIRRKFYILYEFQRSMPIAVWRLNDLAEAEQSKQIALTIATNLTADGLS